jgi:uncharacterized membrane protein
MENITVTEGKTNAVISHLTIIGTFIAVILNNSKKNSFASFHIRQNIGINVLYFINQWIIYKYVNAFAGWIIGVTIFVIWMISLIGVLKNEEKKIPFFGNQFQEWFKNF